MSEPNPTTTSSAAAASAAAAASSAANDDGGGGPLEAALPPSPGPSPRRSSPVHGSSSPASPSQQRRRRRARPPRLRAAARYGPFRPRALATSGPWPCSAPSVDDGEGEEEDERGTGRGGPATPARRASASSHSGGGGGGPALGGGGPALGGGVGNGTMAALAGPLGVAVLPVSAPHKPSLVLRHASPSSGGGGLGAAPTAAVSSLAFQPSRFDGVSEGGVGAGHLLLAAARGSGVLVWDASGRSLSPLLGRLGVADGASTASSLDDRGGAGSGGGVGGGGGSGAATTVTGMAWKGPDLPLLVTTSDDTACLWDLRQWRRGGGGRSRPALRYALRSSNDWSGGGGTGFVHVACAVDGDGTTTSADGGGGGIFATMDGTGVVRTYDDRSSSGPLSVFRSHSQAGIGVAGLPGGQWLTWGLDDAPIDDGVGDGDGDSGDTEEEEEEAGGGGGDDGGIGAAACVKVWSDASTLRSTTPAPDDDDDDDDGSGRDDGNGGSDPDSYWYMDGTNRPPSRTDGNTRSYVLTGKISVPGLACARVCPAPYSRGVVTVRRDMAEGGGEGAWMADLWRLDGVGTARPTAATAKETATFGAERQSTLYGGGHDDHALREMLFGGGGGSDAGGVVGPLVAAELAVGPAPPSAFRDRLLFDDADDEDDLLAMDDDGGELLLCCLSSGGYLTASSVPGSSNLDRTRRRRRQEFSSPRRRSPTRQSPTRLVGGGLGGYRVVHPTRPSSSAEPFNAAPIYHQGPGGDLGNVPYRDASQPAPGPRIPSLTPTDSDADGAAIIARGVEGGWMQFDMDGHGGAGANSASAMETGGAGSDPVGAIEDKVVVGEDGVLVGGGPSVTGEGQVPIAKNEEDAASGGRGRNKAIDPFKAMGVPCPPLCGATFGRGGGGIVCFNNGAVRKMWTWFQGDLQSRSVGSERGDDNRTTGRRSPSFLQDEEEHDANEEEERWQHPVNAVAREEGHGRGIAGGEPRSTAALQKSPRTMLDLIRMNAAAKIAQWGEEENDGNGPSGAGGDADDESGATSTSGDESDDDDFVDDDSSSAISPDRESQEIRGHKRSQSKDLYDAFFPNSRRPLASASSHRKVRSVGVSGSFGGPSTDLLAPVVLFTRRHDGIVLNGQCPELAEGMRLGPWWFTVAGTDPRQSDLASGRAEADVSLQKDGWGWEVVTKGSEPDRDNFPSASSAASKEEGEEATGEFNSSISRNFSFSGFGPNNRPNEGITLSDRPSSQGQPLQQESMMGNLRKLFYSNQRGNTITPPDQNIIETKKSRSSFTSGHASSEMTLQGGELREPSVVNVQKGYDRPKDRRQAGIYTRSTEPEIEASRLALKQHFQTQDICLHNASVCRDLGQTDKSDVWSILAQVVDNMATLDSGDFNLWGGALGLELVSNILRYYEAQGDVQMLSTIVCVLSEGRDRRRIVKQTDGNLQTVASPANSSNKKLLPVDNGRFDAYIMRYSALLYSWGLLTVRAELNKHLSISVPGGGGEQLIPLDRTTVSFSSTGGHGDQFVETLWSGGGFLPNSGVASGITFAPLCPRCHRPARPDANVCDNCKDYAFRCSICTNAVRGLFTVCVTCGHGGHVEHIVPWFARSTVCPSGCGCSCILNTFVGSSREEKLSNIESSVTVGSAGFGVGQNQRGRQAWS